MTKAVVIVEGGNVQSVYTKDRKPGDTVEIVDHDNLKERMPRERREAYGEAAIAGLEEIGF